MKKRTLYTLLLSLLSTIGFSQATGDYRSTGAVDLNTATNWETFTGSWVAAVVAPNAAGLTTGNTITILATHAWGNTLDATIPAGVTLIFQGTGGAFTAAKTITVNGALEQNTINAIPTTGLFVINGTLKHNADVSLILKTNATYATGSTIWVTGVVSNSAAAQLPTTCYNVIWDCTSQTSASTNTFVPNTTTTINGDLTIHSTGTGGTPGAIYIGGGASARTINLAGNLLIDGGELRLVNSGGSVTQTLNVTGNVTISGNGKLTLSGSTTAGATGTGAGKLNVKGNFSHTSGTLGNATGATVRLSTITFTGTSAQAFTTTGLVGDSVAVTINGTTPVVTLNSDLTLSKGLFTITSGSLVISAGKYLTLGSSAASTFNSKNVTLKSDASGTAGIGKITGTISNTSNVTVERYIPSNNRKSYILVTSPVSSPTINAAWQEGGATIANYGTHITGATAGNGFDAASASGFASIFTYNDVLTSGNKWVGLTNTDVNTLAAGKGYLLYVRGDRTVAPGSVSTGNTTLRATGAITTGDFTPTLTTSGSSLYNLVANPYPCPIDWTSANITKTDIADAFWVYDPTDKVFVSYNGGIVSPANARVTQYLQSGQAFFIQNAASGTPSITFKEAAKTTAASTASLNTVFGEDEIKTRININIYSKNNNELADGVVAIFSNHCKAGIGKEDAGKMDNFNETFALTRNNKRLSIEGRPTIKGTDTLFFAMNNFSKKEYVLKIDGSNFSEANAILIDNYTGVKTAIDLAQTITYNFTVNGDAASSSNDRFIITFGSIATTNTANDMADNNSLFVKLSPNPVHKLLLVNFKTTGKENAIIKIINTLGQEVRNVNAGKISAGNITIATADLSAGIYTVQLLSGDKKIAVKKIVKE